VIRVALEKDLRVQFPTVTAEVKLSVEPGRAPVFVDGVFAGHVAEFDGVGRTLLVAPGQRKITVSLTGYQTFETDVTLLANQKFKIKTELTKVGVPTTPLPNPESQVLDQLKSLTASEIIERRSTGWHGQRRMRSTTWQYPRKTTSRYRR